MLRNEHDVDHNSSVINPVPYSAIIFVFSALAGKIHKDRFYQARKLVFLTYQQRSALLVFLDH